MLGKFDMTSWQLHMAQRPITRRTFLQVTGLAGAGFLVGCAREADAPTVAAEQGPAAATATEAAAESLNAFVRIASDDTVTVICKHLDKGQGVTTGLPTIVAEELDADWSQMRAEFAPADAGVYGNLFWGPVQGTGGSSSIANSWTQLRQAAAGARAMLVGAAAAAWGVPAGEIEVARGKLSHGDNSATFGELAASAADIAPPATPVLKSPEQFTLIGTRLPRLDSAAKTDGSATFTSDVDLPGMVHAAIAHAPKFGASVKSFDATSAQAMTGVHQVVQVPRGVAVVADSFWTATRARDMVEIEWDESQAEQRGSAEIAAEYRQALGGDGVTARDDGDAAGAITAAATQLSAEYELPYLAHATMEPMNCVAQVRGDGCELWVGSQVQTIDQAVVAQIAGVDPGQVHINTHFAGGSFGRRAVPDSDYTADAVAIAKAAGLDVPVKLQWTRENDMRGGRYRPLNVHRIRAGIDDSGNLVAWHHSEAIQSFVAGTPFEGLIQNGVDSTSVEGASNLPYAIANYRVDLHTMPGKVPTLWWRSVGHTQNAFVTETFFDEVATAAGRDPVEMRLAMIGEHPRQARVLELAAEQAGWGSALSPGRGRGVALHESFGTKVAQVVEVTVRDDGGFSVDRVVCAVDCGIAINPDIVRAQIEGGIGYGLSAALREAIELDGGRVKQGNFDRYRPLRIDEMPQVDVHIVASNEDPTGIGEPGVPPIAPAVANALFAVTGQRLRNLPLM